MPCDADYKGLQDIYDELFLKFKGTKNVIAQAHILNSMLEIYKIIDGHRCY